MKADVPYDRQTLNTPNPIARFAHRRRYAATLALVGSLVPERGSVLDFGCGTGAFLEQLSLVRPDVALSGFDPESGHVARHYRHISDVRAIPSASLDVVSCLETLEHLHPAELDGFYEHVQRILRPAGLLVVSVPIILGPPLLLKEMNRMILFRRKSEHDLGELMRAALFAQPARRADDIRGSHKGYDFRRTRETLLRNFTMVKASYSPLNWLPWWLNSQVFWVMRSKDPSTPDRATAR